MSDLRQPTGAELTVADVLTGRYVHAPEERSKPSCGPFTIDMPSREGSSNFDRLNAAMASSRPATRKGR